MKNLNVLIATATLVTFAYCKSTKTSTETAKSTAFNPNEKQVQVAQTRWPNTTVDEIKQGQNIFVTKCTACHENHNITVFSEKKWLHEIDNMAPKANLSPEEKLKLTKHILSYREAHAAVKAN